MSSAPSTSRGASARNVAVYRARRLGDYLGAVACGRFQRCAVCGRFGPILYRRRVVGPKLEAMWGLSPRQARALARKESSDCAHCGAMLRARRLAQVLLERYIDGDRVATSVRVWTATPKAGRLRVAEINYIKGLHEALARLPSYAYSEFRAGVPPGATDFDGVRCEDLTRLTYPDESFDLVVTSETLEHVRDLSAALVEIRRVLQPGGRHLFTVPLLPNVPKTYRRTDRICHPGGDSGDPVVTEFGADLPEILEAAGFAVEMQFGPIRDDDLAQVWVTTRPDEEA